MPTLLFNLNWMSLNIGLALLGLLFGYLMVSKNRLQGLIFFVLWFLFVPNTIYLVTDIQYLLPQILDLSSAEFAVAVFQYLIVFIVGIVTYYFSMLLFEKFLLEYVDKFTANFLIILMNYLIAFAVFLGKIERVNSWNIFNNPRIVISSSWSLLQTKDILLIIFLFGAMISALFFVLKKVLKAK